MEHKDLTEKSDGKEIKLVFSKSDTQDREHPSRADNAVDVSTINRAKSVITELMGVINWRPKVKAQKNYLSNTISSMKDTQLITKQTLFLQH